MEKPANDLPALEAWLRDLPIRRKLRWAILGTAVLALSIVLGVMATFERLAIERASETDLTTLADITAANSQAALAFGDALVAEETLAALAAHPMIRMACLYAHELASVQTVFAAWRHESEQRSCPDLDAVQAGTTNTAHLHVARPVRIGSEVVGTIYLEHGFDRLDQQLTQFTLTALAVFGACLILAASLSNLFQRVIADPISALSGTAAQISETRNYAIRAEGEGGDEIGKLIGGFNDMLDQIDHRDTQLRRTQGELEDRVRETAAANRDLEDAMTRLQATQDQLIQTEKMASLGGLVAGIAHEINTPVGIGVTAASTLRDSTQTVMRSVADGSLSRKALQQFLETADKSSGILLTNLDRASDLIQSFKQVAVDQSSAEFRPFHVAEYIREVLVSLGPKLKRSNITVQTHCPDSLVIESNPGAVSQILTNFIMNGLNHAFDEGQEGTMTITVTPKGRGMTLSFADNGKGMDEKTRKRIFDPFFTTKRGLGGSGLGMHIVHNLVHQTLKGSVTVDSEPGRGTVFTVDIPGPEEAAA